MQCSFVICNKGVLILLIVFKQILLLAVFVFIGYFLSKTNKIDKCHTKLLSALEVNVFLPALVFKTFSNNFTVKYISENYKLIIISSITVAIIALFAHFFSKLLTENSYKRSIYTYSLTIPNISYFGYPLTQGIFGEAFLLSVMVFAIPTNVYMYTLGFSMLTKNKFNAKQLLNPVIITMILGAIIGLSGIKLPSFISELLSTASAPVAPISMLLLGIVLSEYSFSNLLKIKTVYLVTALRLIVIPAVIIIILKLLGLDMAVIPTIMLFAMPCGLNTVVFPKLVDEDCEIGAALALISTTLSIITIPIWLHFFI